MTFTWLTAAYMAIAVFGAFVAWRRSSSVAWLAVSMMVATVLVEQVSMQTGLHYVCVGSVSLIAGVMVRDWLFRCLFFAEAALNFLYQGLWIAASYDRSAWEIATSHMGTYVAAVWAANGVLVVLFGLELQGPKSGMGKRDKQAGSGPHPA